jgi:predicted regulator of amino acid metabolism with ACT domain
VTFRASDGQATDSEVVAITVNNVNRPPVLASVGAKTVAENQALAFGTTASDPDGTMTILTASGLPPGATYTDNEDNTGSFNWTPDYTQAGTFNVTFVSSDGSLADTEVVQITVQNTNRPPVLAEVGAKAGAEGVTLSFRISATDLDGNAITLIAAPTPLGAVFTDSINGAGSFVWTPTSGQSGDYSVTFKASDGMALDSEVVLITINNVNQAPVLAAIGSKSGTEGSELAFSVSANDPDGTSPLLTTSELPSGAVFLDNGNGTGQFDWTPDYDQAGGHAIWFIATDENAAADSEAVSITVTNTNRLPELDFIADKSATVGQPLTFEIYANDLDADSVVLRVRNLPAGATLAESGWNSQLGRYAATFYWVPSPGQEGSYSDLKAVALDLTDSSWQVFQVVVGSLCCTGTTGNVNMSAADAPDLSDLSLLIAYLTQTPRPDLNCLEEANINGASTIDLSDLSLLIAYLTQSPRPTLPDCP